MVIPESGRSCVKGLAGVHRYRMMETERDEESASRLECNSSDRLVLAVNKWRVPKRGPSERR